MIKSLMVNEFDYQNKNRWRPFKKPALLRRIQKKRLAEWYDWVTGV
jgi:hypothetical protein